MSFSVTVSTVTPLVASSPLGVLIPWLRTLTLAFAEAPLIEAADESGDDAAAFSAAAAKGDRAFPARRRRWASATGDAPAERKPPAMPPATAAAAAAARRAASAADPAGDDPSPVRARLASTSRSNFSSSETAGGTPVVGRAFSSSLRVSGRNGTEVLAPRGLAAAASRDENAAPAEGFRFAAASPFSGDALDAVNAAAAARICGSRKGSEGEGGERKVGTPLACLKRRPRVASSRVLAVSASPSVA